MDTIWARRMPEEDIETRKSVGVDEIVSNIVSESHKHGTDLG
jgi:hypothetical protein